jgi:hypothetical protein
MSKVEGIYLRKDLKEFITESFVKRYNVNLENWVEPFAYWDQYNQSTLSNGPVPDGTYVLFGKVEYPSVNSMSFFHIYQFNIVRIMGEDVTFAGNFNEYAGLPEAVKLAPVFPLFKVDQPRAFNKARNIFLKKLNKPLSHLELKDIIKKYKPGSLEDKIFRIRLALQTEIDREK